MSAAELDRLTGATCDSCGSGQTQLRRKRARNGAEMFAWQCLGCGRAASAWIRRATIAQPDNLLDWDEALADAFDTERRKVWVAERDIENAGWRRRYDEHLASPKWRSIRSRVLQRARGVCEGCGLLRAEQVHHLTYRHLGDELLFELVALCEDCHQRAHDGRGRE